MFQTNIKQQSILISGVAYTPETILSLSLDKEPNDFRRSVFAFLQEWFDGNDTLRVQTSGSTGTPKQMLVRKKKMMQSAMATCSFLDLKQGDKALLCMSVDYIAGKMMVVRALLACLDLYLSAPSGHPLKDMDMPFDFAAMIPMQVYNSLQIPEEKERLAQLKHLIIGGGAIDKSMETELKFFPNEIWSTYGMTETLSHIALRRINGDKASEFYTPFDTVDLSLSDEGTLIIQAPMLCDQVLRTNDMVEFRTDGSFRILGRRDNVVNSGGVKIQLEKLESLLCDLIPAPFVFTAVPDSKFGEALVLLLENEFDIEDIRNKMLSVLDVYHMPKYIFAIEKIPMTETGKINRLKAKKIATSFF